MEKLVKFLSENLVENKDKVEVTSTHEDAREIIYLKVAQSDMGLIIGKGGKVIKAIRTLVKIKAIKENKHVYLELVE